MVERFGTGLARCLLTSNSRALLCALACWLGVAAPALALPIFFFGEDLATGGSLPPLGHAAGARTAFLNNLSGGVGTEDFESFATTDVAPLALNFAGSSGNITAVLSNAGGICNNTSNCLPPASGEFATSGVQWLFSDESLVAEFAAPIAALGFYATDVGDLNAQLTITLTDTNGGEFVHDVPHTLGTANASGDLLFWGFVDAANSYTRVQFGLVGGGGDFFGFDDLTIGDLRQVVIAPEPGTLSLLFVAAGACRWRSRASRRRTASN